MKDLVSKDLAFTAYPAMSYTDGHVISHSWFLEKRFDRFDHVSIGVQKQTIPHLKALIKCFKNQGWNWVLHPYKSGHALETKKTPLSKT